MNILVTGGAGFIGSNFILYWMRNHPDDKIVNFDKLTYAGNLNNLRDVENNPNYNFKKGDICDQTAVQKAMDGCDTVVHFAAESHVDRSIINPSDFVNTNVYGTYVLLSSALKNKIRRFHHISTDEVFGSLDIDDNRKFTEDTPYDPRSPYAASKASSDHLVRAYYHTYGLPVTISNCSNNYGPFQFPEKFIPLAIINLLNNRKIPIYGDGFNVRDWIYVEDHCRAIDLILSKGKIGETYCVGGMNRDVNNISIAKKIVNLLGKSDNDIEFIKDRPGHDRKYAINWKKISDELGWKPEKDLDDYLKVTVDWYKKNTGWWQQILSKEYLNYYKMQYGDRV